MPLDAIVVALAATHSHATLRIIGIAFVVIGAFTFTFRRALVARDPGGAPAFSRTIGPIASVLFVVVGLILVATA